jgi:hypothetical protein
MWKSLDRSGAAQKAFHVERREEDLGLEESLGL